MNQVIVIVFVITTTVIAITITTIDDLRKSRGLHSVSAYRSRPVGVAQSRHAFVGGTVSTWAR